VHCARDGDPTRDSGKEEISGYGYLVVAVRDRGFRAVGGEVQRFVRALLMGRSSSAGRDNRYDQQEKELRPADGSHVDSNEDLIDLLQGRPDPVTHRPAQTRPRAAVTGHAYLRRAGGISALKTSCTT